MLDYPYKKMKLILEKHTFQNQFRGGIFDD